MEKAKIEFREYPKWVCGKAANDIDEELRIIAAFGAEMQKPEGAIYEKPDDAALESLTPAVEQLAQQQIEATNALCADISAGSITPKPKKAAKKRK